MQPQTLGLVGVLGKKVLKVLVYPVTDPILGPVGREFAHKWEEVHRPYQVRDFSPNNFTQPAAQGLSTEGWQNLAQGRSLLFIHGTTSLAHTGFAGLPEPTLSELYARYQGRVFAFNHFTLSEDPGQNVDWFLANMPPEIHLDTDIICHSRGGLVARVLAGTLNHANFPQITVKKTVFVASPNNGTILADADHMTDFINRFTTALNLLPPGPVEESFSILITIAKMIVHAALTGLPGLTAMDPHGDFIAHLNSATTSAETQHYAFASEYEPQPGMKDFISKKVGDEIVDRAFGTKNNDLLVPTDGVYEGFNAAGFPISSDRVIRYPLSTGVEHSFYFSQGETSVKLEEWLTGS